VAVQARSTTHGSVTRASFQAPPTIESSLKGRPLISEARVGRTNVVAGSGDQEPAPTPRLLVVAAEFSFGEFLQVHRKLAPASTTSRVTLWLSW